MTKRQICFSIEEDLLKQMEEIRDDIGLPISRQIEMKLNGYDIIKDEKTAIKMKGFYCVDCGKEVPSTIKNNELWFYCDCNGMYKRVAYFREISD